MPVTAGAALLRSRLIAIGVLDPVAGSQVARACADNRPSPSKDPLGGFSDLHIAESSTSAAVRKILSWAKGLGHSESKHAWALNLTVFPRPADNSLRALTALTAHGLRSPQLVRGVVGRGSRPLRNDRVRHGEDNLLLARKRRDSR